MHNSIIRYFTCTGNFVKRRLRLCLLSQIFGVWSVVLWLSVCRNLIKSWYSELRSWAIVNASRSVISSKEAQPKNCTRSAASLGLFNLSLSWSSLISRGGSLRKKSVLPSKWHGSFDGALSLNNIGCTLFFFFFLELVTVGQVNYLNRGDKLHASHCRWRQFKVPVQDSFRRMK